MSSKNIDISSTDNQKNKKEDILSEFTLKGVIGRGTFSIVRLGENKITKEKFAIKIMQKSKIINKEDLKRIEREIQILKGLNHPNVIKIHKIEEDSKKFYIIMEYCENGELFNRIVEKQRLDEDEAALFYYQIISGLEYIHKNKVAHRDLKPENLLLSKNDILKIIDFGLSNFSNSNYLLGTPCGSPCYASPEMVSGFKYNGFLIDIWSTGIILFAMICGYLPFEDKDNEVLFEKIVKCKINYPRHIGDLPLDLMKRIIVPNPKVRITLNEIKEHPFYLKGKLLFNQKYPEYKSLKIREIQIKNIRPLIKTKILKFKDKKENNENNENKRKRIIDKNFKINVGNINNMNTTYQPIITENYDYNRVITINNFKSEDLDINIAKRLDYTKNKDKKLKTQTNHKEKVKEKEKENIDNNIGNDKNINNDKTESPSSILNSDEIPMDSMPNEFNDEKSEKSSNNNKNEKNNKIKEENNSRNITNKQQITNNDSNSLEKTSKTNELNKKSQIVKINLEDIKKKPKPNNNIKEPNDIVFNNNKYKDKEKEKNILKEKIIVEYFPNKKSYNSIERSTTNNSNIDFVNTENNNFNKTNYPIIIQQLPKTSYVNNRITPIYDDKNKILIKEIKQNYSSNSCPKNNNKINYQENKFITNNLRNINNTFYKKIKNTSKYNNRNLNIINEKNYRNNIENDINVANLSSNYNPMNTINTMNGRINIYATDIHNSVNEKNNNKQKISDIFKELQIIQKNKRKIIEQNNNSQNNSNSYTNGLINIFENHSLSVGKVKDPNIILNKFNNSNRQPKIKNKIKTYSERDYDYINNKYQTHNSNINNYRNMNANIIKKINIKNKNHSNYINDKSPIINVDSKLKDKYVDSITINNNNSINLHEPKLYIYVENNNSNIENINENLKTYQNENTMNNPKMAIRLDKNNYDISKYPNRRIITNVNEYSKKYLIKRAITNTNSDKKSNRLPENNKYNNNLYNTIDIKKNKTISIYNDYNENLLDVIRKNNTINKKLYSSKEINNNNNYLFNSNDMFYNSSNKNKNKNIEIINKSNKILNNYYNNELNTSSKNNKALIDKNNYPYQNLHNIAKTEVNLDIWTYDKDRINEDKNILNNQYFINNNDTRALRGKNVNIINSFISNTNPVVPLENIDYKIKLQKIQKRNTLTNKNIIKITDDNYKYIIPKTHKTSNLESFENNRRFNTLANESMHTPIIKNTNYANRNYKKYIKRYDVKK